MLESKSMNLKVEQNAWQEVGRTMRCLSDRPFQISFIKRNVNSEYASEQSENTNDSDLVPSSHSKATNDEFGERSRNVKRLKEPPMKFALRNRAKYLQNSNIARLNEIFNSDMRKTVELTSHCKEIINRELTFWHDRIQFEMKQTDAIRANLHARMERIKKLNRELRDLLKYFDDSSTAVSTGSSTGQEELCEVTDNDAV